MKIRNGPTVEYHLVYRILPRRVYTLSPNGYYHPNGWKRGHLVMSTSMGKAMYHRPEELLRFKCDGPIIDGWPP